MQSNIVNSVFGSYATLIKMKCLTTPPKVVAESNGSSEELCFVQIIKDNTNLNILHKTQNPNYITLYDAHKKDDKDWRFTDWDRGEGDFYLSGFRFDLKVSKKPMGEAKGKKMPSWVAGSIPLTSLVDFPKGDGKSLYLCVSMDWSRMFIVSADDVLEFAEEHLKYSQILTKLREIRAQGKKMETKNFDQNDIFITINQLPTTAYEEIY